MMTQFYYMDSLYVCNAVITWSRNTAQGWVVSPALTVDFIKFRSIST